MRNIATWTFAVAAIYSAVVASSCRAQQADTVLPTVGEHEAASKAWIGLDASVLPTGAEFRGASLIGPADTAEYAIREIVYQGRHWMFLDRFGERVGSRHTATVVDVLVSPDIARGMVSVYAICGTLRPGATADPEPEDVILDPEVLVFARMSDGPVLTEIGRAWRADRGRERFTPIPVVGLACLNEYTSGGH